MNKRYFICKAEKTVKNGLTSHLPSLGEIPKRGIAGALTEIGLFG